MVLALVAGGVVVEDGLARWVRWQSGRRAPWAASSAALGVAVSDSECVHSQADVIHFIAWLAHELRGTVRLCALDGAVWGRRPWWAVWLVVWRVVVAVDAAVTFDVAVLDGEVVVPKGAVSLWGAWPGGCDLFFSLAAPPRELGDQLARRHGDLRRLQQLPLGHHHGADRPQLSPACERRL